MTYPTPEEIRLMIDRKYERVIAIDPGDTTGFCMLYECNPVLRTLNYSEFLRLLTKNDGCQYETFVVEQFVTRPGVFAKTQIAGKVCGALDLYCLQNGLPIIYQQPSTIKTMLPDKTALKAAGWSWSTPHECDALRHAIYYLLTRK